MNLVRIDPTKLCQIEFAVSDVERSKAFFANVFGWNPVPADIHNYIVLDVPAECAFGISLIPSTPSAIGSQNAPTPTLYFQADDATVAEVTKVAKQWHGSASPKPMSLFGYGKVTFIKDPDGYRFGLIHK